MKAVVTSMINSSQAIRLPTTTKRSKITLLVLIVCVLISFLISKTSTLEFQIEDWGLFAPEGGGSTERISYQAVSLRLQLQCEAKREGHYFIDATGSCRQLPGVVFSPVRGDVKHKDISLVTDSSKLAGGKSARFVSKPDSFEAYLERYVPDLEDIAAKFEAHSPTKGRDYLIAYLTFVYRSSWLLPNWADFTDMLRALPDKVSISTTPVFEGKYGGVETNGLYTLSNFCVTMDGRLVAPPNQSDYASKLAPFTGVSEFRYGRYLTKRAFFTGAVPLPRGTVLPPYLPGRVMIMPLEGGAIKHNTGHMLHRLTGLNLMRRDLRPELMLVVADFFAGPKENFEPRDLFHNGCSDDIASGHDSSSVLPNTTSMDEEEEEQEGVCVWRSNGYGGGNALAAHHEILGLPIAGINLHFRNKHCRRTKCYRQLRDNNAKVLQAGWLHTTSMNQEIMGSLPESKETPIHGAFMCFKEGFFYHNHRTRIYGSQHKGPSEEESTDFVNATSIVFRAAREVPNGGIQYKDVVANSAEERSVFDTKRRRDLPSSLTQNLSGLERLDAGQQNPWRYAFGQLTAASSRKGEMLRHLRGRAAVAFRAKSAITLSAMRRGEVVASAIPSGCGLEETYEPRARRHQLSLLFSVRTMSRRIPYFAAFATHLSRAFPFIRFHFAEESSKAFEVSYIQRLASQSDIFIGVHGALLTNLVYMPITANSTLSDRGGVFVELSSAPLTVTANPQSSTFGTLASSLGIPKAKITFNSSTYLWTNQQPANHSLDAVMDSVALGVCMWCEHNFQNPHRPDPTGGLEWKVEDIKRAGLFDTRCSQSAHYRAPRQNVMLPLPAQQWDRCCSCVFQEESYLSHGSPVLHYDVPIAPIIDRSAISHINQMEMAYLYTRTLRTTIVAFALSPTIRFVEGERLSTHILHSLITKTKHVSATISSLKRHPISTYESRPDFVEACGAALVSLSNRNGKRLYVGTVSTHMSTEGLNYALKSFADNYCPSPP